MASISVAGRRRVYLACLVAGLSVWFTVAAWASLGNPKPSVQGLLLASVVVAVAALRLLRPRPGPYYLGIGCLVLAGVAGWLGGPDGSSWIGDQVLQDPDYRYNTARTILPLFAPAFLLGWHLLAASVGRWWSGIPLYLGISLLCSGILLGAQLLHGLLSPVGAFDAAQLQLAASGLVWPIFLLTMLQDFGWSLT